MKPLRDYLVSADINAQEEINVAGKTIFIDKDFNPLERRVQVGTIFRLPLKHKGDVREGDIAYFHHFVVEEGNQFTVEGNKVYLCSQDNLFAIKRNGELVPQNDYVLCSQIYEPLENYQTKSGIWLKHTPDKVPFTVKIEYVSQSAYEAGFRKGQLIIHTKGVDYSMNFSGKSYIKIETKWLLAENSGLADYSLKEDHEVKL